MSELLSICIPTYNRAHYLDQLLGGLISELKSTPNAAQLIRLSISDNNSTDHTAKVVAAHAKHWSIAYARNSVNIGGDSNFKLMIEQATGDYFWLLGDDELVVPGFLKALLNVLRPGQHDLVLLATITESGARYGEAVPGEPNTFTNYASFVDYYRNTYPWMLMLHSFISMMVVRRSSHDGELQRQMLNTVDRHYAHMYGVVQGVTTKGGSIHLLRQPCVRIRDQRALVDTSLLRIRQLWSRYYYWLARKFGHPDLGHYGKRLFGWRYRVQLAVEQFKVAIGFGPKILR